MNKIKTGYCSVCKRDDIKRLNKAIDDGWSYNAVKEVFPDAPAKDTFFKHKKHRNSPLLTQAEAARASNPLKSNKEVLEAIRDIGLQNAMEHPEKVNTNHAIRAAAILAEKEKTEQVHIVLAQLLQGPAPTLALPEIIEGEYTPVQEERDLESNATN